MTQVLLGILTALAVAECCRMLEWTARRLIAWADWLTYGRTARAHTRFIEHCGDLDQCHGQIAKLLFALALFVRGIVNRLYWATGRSGSLVDAGAGHFNRVAAEALSHALQSVDLRGMPRLHRREVGRRITQLRDLLQRPVEAFNEEGAAVILTAVASASEALISDRTERAALGLARAADAQVARMGRCHPAAFDVRRAHAHALLELGCYLSAEELLQALNQDEVSVFGRDDPRTFPTLQLLAWVRACKGSLAEAEAGLRAIKAGLANLPRTDLPLLWHVSCKLSWVVGQQPGRLAEAAESYDGVVLHRTHACGIDHGDTLDARHSKGKMFVVAMDGARAHAILLPLLADRRRVEGRHHPDTLETRKYLALANALMQPLSARVRRRTLRELRRVRRMQTRRFGRDHPNTRDTIERLERR